MKLSLNSVISLVLGVIASVFFFSVIGGNTLTKGLYLTFGVANTAICLLANKYGGKGYWYPDPIFSFIAQTALSFLVLALAS